MNAPATSTVLRAPSPAWRKLLIICSIAMLVAMFVVRLLGPSDLFDQTQPKTISYTTDIIVHGGTHWLLPLERGELPATKPPLYNWLAVPAVKWLGFNSEIAHKLPSVAAMLGCWLIIVRLGRSLGQENGGDDSLGWLAGLIFVANYSIFKLSYLARPDMLLTLWILIAWLSATRALRDGAHPALNAAVFWFAVTLAGLTKGPAALVVVVYVIVAARVIGGRWTAVWKLRPLVGGLLSLLVCGAWVFAVWKIDPQHLKQELWFNEIYGRVTGTGAEGTSGRGQWLREIPYQSFYYFTRMAPWTVLAILGAIAIWRRRSEPALPLTLWIRASLLLVAVVVGLFSLSVGKRADYVAVACPQTALLAAWWLCRCRPFAALRWPWLVPVAAVLSLASISFYDHKQIWSPEPGFGEAIQAFTDQAAHVITAEPGEVLNCAAGQTQLQAMLGIAEPDQRRQLSGMIARGEPFWVVAGRTQNAPYEFDQWMNQRRMRATVESVVRSAELPRDAGWPGQVTLWRVTPH